MFCLWAWKGFSKRIGCHVVGRAINKLDGSIVDDEADKVVMNVDVFGLSMVVRVSGDGDGGLIITVKCGRFREGTEDKYPTSPPLSCT